MTSTQRGRAELDARRYEDTVVTGDGSLAVVRAVRTTDLDALVRLHTEAPDESIYRRFFSLNRAYAERYVTGICAQTSTTWSLLAEVDGQVVGVASAEPIPDTGPAEEPCAEVAVLVASSYHGRGIGTLLVEHLADWITAELGITRFLAEVLMENTAMLRVFHDAGFTISSQREHGIVALSMDVRPTGAAVAAMDRRERRAESESLRHLFEPRSVAVVGVSRHRGGIGREVAENVAGGGYDGDLYVVGRSGLSVQGAHTVTDVQDLPSELDLAVVSVPPGRLEATIQTLARNGTHACIVLTSGLGETGGAGREVEQRLAATARDHGMRLVGPNCFGVTSRLRETSLNATFGGPLHEPGRFALASQSGGVGISALHHARQRRLGLACFASLGNKLDVSGNDLLAAWADDPDIAAAGLYLESFGNPQKFARLAATFGRTKPLLAVFGGHSVAGHRAGTTHTAASATPDRALQAMFATSGVIEADGVSDLVDTALLLTGQPLPLGARVAVVSNAGGLGILAADQAHRAGLEVVELPVTVVDTLRAAVPTAAGLRNPVDLGAGATAESFAAAMRLLLQSDAVDTILVDVADTAVTDVAGIVDGLIQVVREDRSAPPDTSAHPKPCLLVMEGETSGDELADGAFACYRDIEGAVRALAHAVRYARWRASTATAEAEPSALPWRFAGPSRPPGVGPGRWLQAHEAERLLSGVGVRSAPSAVLSSADEAVAAAERIGYPVVVKTALPEVVHKTDRALVRTGLYDADQVSVAVRTVQAVTGPRSPVLVQAQVTGPEIAVGLVREGRFGPLVMVASGGVSLDLWADQQFLMPPFTSEQVHRSLESLRTWPLLAGFRGTQPVDVDSLVAVVEGVQALALRRPDVLEMDLNPVIVTPGGAVCVDAKVKLG